MPGELNDLACSAEDAGLSSSSNPASGTTGCPAADKSAGSSGASASNVSSPPPLQRSYEYCDIDQLTVALASPKKSATIAISKIRWNEPVARSAPARYRSALSSNDLVIEAVSDVRDETAMRGAATRGSSEARPLTVTLTASDGASHYSFTPAHPHTALQDDDGVKETHGGAPVKAELYARDTSGMSRTTWGMIWPFGEDRVRRYTASGDSCGVRAGAGENRQFSAVLVVMPYEEWTVSIGLKGTSGKSWSKTHNAAAEKVEGQTATVTKVVERSGADQTTTKTTTFEGGLGTHEKTETTKQELQAHVFTTDTQDRESFFDIQLHGEKEAEVDPRKVTIKRSIGGREVETDVSETLKRIWEIKKLFEDIQAVFESAKIGLSISAGYELFNGTIDFGWGIRWPADYAEHDRVYYVERFVSAGGSCDLIAGSLTGFFGFAFDPWYAPVTVEVGAYITGKLKFTLSAKGELTYTNAVTASGPKSIKLDPKASFDLEFGAKANGRAFGYSIETRLAIEGGFKITGDGEFRRNAEPYMKVDVIIGKDHEGTTEGETHTPDALRIVGEMVTQGDTIKRRKIKPIVIFDGCTLWKDHYLWGHADKSETSK